MSSYTLMIEDIPLVEFSIKEGRVSLLRVVGPVSRLPLKIIQGVHWSGSVLPENLESWLKTRVYQKGRANFDDILKIALKGSNLSKENVLRVSKGVNVSDSYWVKSNNESLQWLQVNPRKVVLNKGLSYVAFSGDFKRSESLGGVQRHWDDGKEGLGISGEFSLGGSYPKAWRRGRDDKLYLWKTGISGFANSGKEPYMEWQASEVLNYLEIPHVPYEIHKWQKRVSSVCQNQANEEVFWEPLADCLYIPKRGVYNYREVYTLLHNQGGTALSEAYKQTLIADCLVLNSDSHLQNVSLKRCVETGRVLGLTPIYDLNLSLDPYMMQNDEFTIDKTGPCLAGRESFIEQAVNLVGKEGRYKEWFHRARGYTVKQHRSYTIPRWRVQISTKMVREVARGVLQQPSVHSNLLVRGLPKTVLSKVVR